MYSLYSPVPKTTSPDITVPETIGNAEVCVTLTTSVKEAITIGYITLDGSATGKCKHAPYTVEPPNKGHFRAREVVPILEVK